MVSMRGMSTRGSVCSGKRCFLTKSPASRRSAGWGRALLTHHLPLPKGCRSHRQSPSWAWTSEPSPKQDVCPHGPGLPIGRACPDGYEACCGRQALIPHLCCSRRAIFPGIERVKEQEGEREVRRGKEGEGERRRGKGRRDRPRRRERDKREAVQGAGAEDGGSGPWDSGRHPAHRTGCRVPHGLPAIPRGVRHGVSTLN